jgi:hypothetical protein
MTSDTSGIRLSHTTGEIAAICEVRPLDLRELRAQAALLVQSADRGAR